MKKKVDSKSMVDDEKPDLKLDSVETQRPATTVTRCCKQLNFSLCFQTLVVFTFLTPICLHFKKKPFKDSARVSDIDFGCSQSYSTKFLLTIPENFFIEETPKPLFIRMEDSSILFSREVFPGGNQLLVRNSFNINRALFTKEEYSGVKSFFDKVYALINEQIILKKRKNKKN